MKNLEKREVRSHNEVRALFAENKVRFARARVSRFVGCRLLSHVVFLYRYGGCRPMFLVQNAQREAVFQMSGPMCRSQGCCPADFDFPVVHSEP